MRDRPLEWTHGSGRGDSQGTPEGRLLPSCPGGTGRHFAGRTRGLRNRGENPRRRNSRLGYRLRRARPWHGVGSPPRVGRTVSRSIQPHPPVSRVRPVNLTERIVAIHHALEAGGVPHAFGGALALAWCTPRPRATIDIDVNLFVGKRLAASALENLPRGITVSSAAHRAIARDGQVRLRWDDTPMCSSALRPFTMRRRNGYIESTSVDRGYLFWLATIWPFSRHSSTGRRTGSTWRRCPHAGRSTPKRWRLLLPASWAPTMLA